MTKLLRGLNTLLVDDEDDINFLHTRVIKKSELPLTIMGAFDGINAIARLEQMQAAGQPAPDLIFLDIKMPELDGWGFLRRFTELSKDWTKNTSIYLLTTSLNPDDKNRAEEFEVVDGVLDKILSEEQIQEVLKNLLSSPC